MTDESMTMTTSVVRVLTTKLSPQYHLFVPFFPPQSSGCGHRRSYNEVDRRTTHHLAAVPATGLAKHYIV